ncbi:MAG: GYF domain-containing protein [Armatimonadota bacterium]
MERDEVAWYYRPGGETLGPVSWREIEAMLADTFDADTLLVARGGDEGWSTAADAMRQHPELASGEPAPSAAAEEVIDEAGAEDWTLSDLDQEPRAVPTGGMTPQHGLGKWLGQAWEMVIGDIWVWVTAMLLVILVSAVTLGIAGPPLSVGLYIMSLRSFDRREIAPHDVFRGFSRFWSAWGVTLIAMVPAVLLAAPLMILIAVPVLRPLNPSAEELTPLVLSGIYLLIAVLHLLRLAIQTIFFYSWALVAEGYGAWEAVVGSWTKVRVYFWSYLGMFVLLTIIAGLGSCAFYVGLLVTYPLLPCTVVAAYRWHFRQVADAAAG